MSGEGIAIAQIMEESERRRRQIEDLQVELATARARGDRYADLSRKLLEFAKYAEEFMGMGPHVHESLCELIAEAEKEGD